MKYYYLPVEDSTPIPCFSCGRLMSFVKGEKTRECLDCEVTELRLQGEYVVMTRKMTSVIFYGEKIEFTDHSLEHRPHP